jgi:succinoglycan biosynthesis transport protein ExoP
MFDFSTRMSGEQPVRMVLPQAAEPRTEARVILRRLWRGSGFIVLGALFMVAAAVALLGLIPPRYTSSICGWSRTTSTRGSPRPIAASPSPRAKCG